MVRHPAEYKWSSYAANAQGALTLIIQPHGVYMAIGLNASSRLEAYRELFRHSLDIGIVDEIRKVTNGNYVLGSSKFAEQIAEALGRRVIAGKSGRPKLTDA
jgi:putative transposase